jgi:flagellar basal-body rod modification protein FlgD
MSTINSVNGSPELKTPATGNRQLGKNEFLKLLTTQLANQDPLSPTDNQAFIAQLAQFASVEQSEQMVGRLDALLMAQTANNQTATTSLVGKDVIYKTNTVDLPASGGASISGELRTNAAMANAIITDETGKKLRTITLRDVAAGTVNFAWDGKDDNGNPVKAGTYKVSLTAADDKQGNVAIDHKGRGRVSAVSFDNGIPELIVDGRRVKMSDILQIAEASTTSAPAPTPSRTSLADLFNTLSRS